MQKEISLMIIIGLMFSFVGFSPFQTIVVEEPAAAGKELSTHVNLRNELDENVEDVNVRVFIYELGLAFYSNGFDISKNDGKGLWVFGDLPKNTPKGDYLARVTASNDHFRDVRHVYIAVE